MSETIVVSVIVVVGFAIWLAMHWQGRLRYRQKALLAGLALEFFHRLRLVLPECVVAPQVGLSALIEPVGIGRARQAALALIAHRRVAYAVFDEQIQLLAVVELDHRSRRNRVDMAIDRHLEDAGIRTVRFSAKQLPSDAYIRSCIFARPHLPRHRNNTGAGEMADIEFERPKGSWRNTMNAHY